MFDPSIERKEHPLNNEQDIHRQIARLLENIRDQQRIQSENQTELLALQKKQYELVKSQYDRHKALQEKAELIQDKSAQLVEKGRRTMAVILPVVVVLILVLAWMMFWQ